jgi:thiamine transport system ATP-binding protein
LELRFENARIRRGRFALDADFSVASGETVALIGPSGGGKSTLLEAIAGFVPLESGRLVLGASDMSGKRPADRPVTLLFQEHNLFPHLTVFQNVALGVRPDLKLSPEERVRVADALVSVGLPGRETSYPEALSGGQRQRVALARALLRHRPILLLDEPFAALGPALRAEMLDLVASIIAENSMTLLMVTHLPEDAKRIARKTVIVDDGEAGSPVDTLDLLSDPPASLREYLGS